MIITQSPAGRNDLLCELRQKRVPLIPWANCEPGGSIVIGGLGMKYMDKGGVQAHAHSIQFSCVQQKVLD